MTATIGTLLYTKFCGKLVGQDEFGNKYYVAKREKNAIGKHKRWVVYNGVVEPSKVPAIWHGWLHYTSDMLPNETSHVKYSWLKRHLPNLTGTKFAYLPAGHINQGGKRAKTTADYQAWNPQAKN